MIIAFIADRGYYASKHKETAESTLKKRKRRDPHPYSRLGLVGLVASLVVYYQTRLGLLGVASLSNLVTLDEFRIACSGFALLQWSQNALGGNWSDNPRMIKGQEVITSGPYRIIRHPIYAAVFLIRVPHFISRPTG